MMEIKKTKVGMIEMIGLVDVIVEHVFEKDEDGNYVNYMPELYDYAVRLAFAGGFCEYEPTGNYDEDYNNLLDNLDIGKIYEQCKQAYVIEEAAQNKIEYIKAILIRNRQFDIFTPLVLQINGYIKNFLDEINYEGVKKLVESDGDLNNQSGSVG